MEHVRTKTSAMLADMADSMPPLGPALDGVARSDRDACRAIGRLAAIVGHGCARPVVAAVELTEGDSFTVGGPDGLYPAVYQVSRVVSDAGTRIIHVVGPMGTRDKMTIPDMWTENTLVIAGYTNRRAKRQRGKMRRRARFAASEAAA